VRGVREVGAWLTGAWAARAARVLAGALTGCAVLGLYAFVLTRGRPL
jgi:hypothetical protein